MARDTKPRDGQIPTTTARWWASEENDVHSPVISVIRHIRFAQQWRRDADEYHAELYAGGPSGAGIRGLTGATEYLPARLPYNVARGAADTLVSKVAKHRPLPQVLTTRGDWAQQKRARKMSQFIEGQFYHQRIFENKAPVLVRDSAIFGRGILKIWAEGKNLLTERAHPWELHTDEWDSRYGDPRNLYHLRTVDRGVLIERFAKNEDGEIDEEIAADIEAAGEIDDQYLIDQQHSYDTTVDRVHFVEAWHLPSGPDADDGRHVIVIEGRTLLDEPWERSYFPFAMLGYSAPIAGYWPQGLIEQLEGFQYEINFMAEKVSESHATIGGCIVAIPSNSGITDTHLINGVGYGLKHNPGAAPTFFNPEPVHPATYQRLRDLPQEALADVGLSQMSAQSTKPAGIDSGLGLQTLDDIETERFVIFGRAYESWCLDIARQFVDCAKEIAQKEGEYAIQVPLKNGMLPLSWKDVSIDDFELKVFSTSTLPQQPAARLDKLQSLFDAGVVDRAVFLRELDAPELSAELDLETSDKLFVDEMLEAMLEADEPDDPDSYHMPTPYIDLQWASKRAQQRINKAGVDGAPEDNLDLLRRFTTDCIALQARMNAPPPQAQAMPPGQPPMMGPPPGAAPMPPPPDLPPTPPPAAMGAPQGPIQ